jgi:hypothetical protein
MASHDKHQALFAALVTSYTSQAMVCLGKIANPQTGETERDLEQASALIDVLGMLEAKTTNNLSDEEASMLRQSLSMLRLNYVDESQKREEPEDTGGADAGGAEASAGDDEAETSRTSPTADTSEG